MVAYLGYTLRMRTLFRGWPIMVNDTHTRRRLKPNTHCDKVEFNTVDSVESRQSRPCRFGPIHTGDNVDCIDRTGSRVDWVGDNVDRNKLSNLSCCRFVTKTGHKVDIIGNKVHRISDSRLCCPFDTGFGNSRVCRQCVPGFTEHHAIPASIFCCCRVTGQSLWASIIDLSLCSSPRSLNTSAS